MEISGRNKLPGTVREIERSGPIAKVVMDVGGGRVVALVTSEAVDELGLKEGQTATALIKATSVMLMK
ncbi:MAG: TOBE domain-containing protein [Limnochordia bacterium]|jgi:molybdopterin-binding protein|nr:TOBE domain-containing protein [Bacillota bacterium]